VTFYSPALARIVNGKLCSGCGLCSALAPGKIEMQLSESGYLRPTQKEPLSQEEEKTFTQICPGGRIVQQSTEGRDDLLWGPLLTVRTGSANDNSLRHHASSGGVLSALLLYLLDSKTVDYVVQNRASETRPIENATVESVSRDDIFQAAGSRYAPSSPLSKLDERLSRPGRFVFVGKPCDVAGLRAFARHDPRVDEKIPLMLSFFCAGVPSLRGTREILAKLHVREEDVERFQFRGDGWPGHATAWTRDGREARMSYADSWGGVLSKHTQFRCKICPDGSGGFADIACADAWYSDEAGYPLFEEEDGRSLIVSRTAKGEALVAAAIDKGYINAKTIDAGEIVKMQPSQARRKQLIISRLLALALFRRPLPRYAGLNLTKAAFMAGVWPNLRSFLGTVRRLLASSE
jgi:coenzyme F420 hydrogenase subunit beta